MTLLAYLAVCLGATIGWNYNGDPFLNFLEAVLVVAIFAQVIVVYRRGMLDSPRPDR